MRTTGAPGTHRSPIHACLAALVWLSPLGPAATAGAQDVAVHVRPIAMVEQLAWCRELVDRGEGAGTLRRCFAHAGRLLDEGMRRRRAAPQQSRAFEEELERGARDIGRRLAALSLDDPGRRDRALRELDGAIHALRDGLSRIAAAEGAQLSLVSRGGVSLGNWQAGFLYAVTEWGRGRRANAPGAPAARPVFSTATGASAGAVNGFAATVEGCRPADPSPRDSLYFQIWMDLGMFGRHGKPGLFPPPEGGSTALALFTSEALEATLEKVRRYVERGGQLPACTVDFGFVATHLDPKQSPVHVRADGDPILTTKKLKEKFSVRLRFADPADAGRTTGRAGVRVTNLGPTGPAAADRIYYAGVGHAKRVPLPTLLSGVQASAAFPGAFPPVVLPYTQYVPGPNDVVLSREQTATFIDGGILDNTPIGLAVALDSWRDETAEVDPHLAGLVPAEPRTYLFLEPLVRSWARGGAETTEATAAQKELLQTYLGFTSDLLATTTDAQLSNTAEQFGFVRRQRADWIEPRLSVPERNMPITGAQFDHFMAFLERDFRIFDFYVGMADAHRYLEQEACLTAPEGTLCEPPESLVRVDAALREADPNYRCIRAYYDSDAARTLAPLRTQELPAACAELRPVVCGERDDRPDSRASVSAFLESGSVQREAGEDLCVEPAIANHNFRALLASMHNFKVWMQSDEYAESRELDRFFEELSSGEQSERFVWVDLPTHLGRDEGYLESAEVKRAFRSLVQQSIDRIADAQGLASEYLLRLSGRAVADLVYGKDYPRQIFGVGIVQSGLEAVYGRRLFRPNWRWDTTFRYFNLGVQSYAPDLEPFTSDFYLSTQGTWILSPASFLDAELGLGWAVSETIAYNGPATGHVAFRSGPRTYFGLVALHRIYLALNVDYYPIISIDRDYRDTGTEVADEWNWKIAAGWRFLF